MRLPRTSSPDHLIARVAREADIRRRLHAGVTCGTIAAAAGVSLSTSLVSTAGMILAGATAGAWMVRRRSRGEAADRIDGHLGLPQTLGTFARADDARRPWLLASAERAAAVAAQRRVPTSRLKRWPPLVAVACLVVALTFTHGGRVRDQVVRSAEVVVPSSGGTSFVNRQIIAASTPGTSARAEADGESRSNPASGDASAQGRSQATSGRGSGADAATSASSISSAVSTDVPRAGEGQSQNGGRRPGQGDGVTPAGSAGSPDAPRPATASNRPGPSIPLPGTTNAAFNVLPARYRDVARRYFALSVGPHSESGQAAPSDPPDLSNSPQ